MLSHVTLGVADLDRAAAFYDAVLGTLGLKRYKTGAQFAGWGEPGGVHFFVTLPFDSQPATPGNGVSVSFAAPTRAAVGCFWDAALAAGGKDEGAPGLRPQYHPAYFAAYVRDPDGNKIAAVCHI